MPPPLLITKLHIPPLRPARVRRARLLAKLQHGQGRTLTLISAPAGFGKTTLAREWVAERDCAIAWVSLDAHDRPLTSFLAYVITALRQNVAPTFGETLLSHLDATPQPPMGALLTEFINQLDSIASPFVLVLDDYHTLDSPDIDAALTVLIDRQPPQMHLLITTREDPQLPLARLRARNSLTEIRANDLRFTPDEAADFFAHAVGLPLDMTDVTTLQARTEGWAVGLHLAALALQTTLQAHPPPDSSAFIRAFSGSHRFVLDYLVEEVLDRQPAHIQHFLLSTALLDRLCGALCDAVLGSATPSGQAVLEACEQANLMLIPLDDERRWYRYHHLFGEVLRARLTKMHPERVRGLHQRASDWYAQNDLFAEAIHHAQSAHDDERLCALVERAWPSMRRTRQEATFRQWVRALPDALIRQRPVLSVVCAWVLLDAGDYDAVESRLRDAEDLLQAAPEARIIADARQLASLPATIANARAYRAQAQNDLAGTIHYTRLALELLPEKDAYERGTTTALLGLAYWAAGDLDSAYRAFTHGLDQLERGGGLLIRLGGTIVLGQIRTAQGQLRAAADAHHDALRLAMAHGEPLPKGTAEQYLGLADVSFWRGQYAQSEAFMAQGTRLRERASLPGYDHLWCIVAARQKHAAGDTDTALGLLDEAERLYYRSPIPDVRPIGAIRARMLLAANRLPEALDWAHENGLALDAPPDYLQEYASLTRVRVLLAHGRASDAQEVLARLMSTAKAAGRSGSVFEITLLQALAHHAQADLPSALDALWHALTWAEPEGYIRPFVDEGQPMAALLRSAVERGLSGFAQAVLAAFPPHLAPSPDLSPAHPLVEPLSAREAEVLRLLKTELSGPELAELLGVALSTVRTHIKNIYAKLGVTNRRAAVNRAEQLGWM